MPYPVIETAGYQACAARLLSDSGQRAVVEAVAIAPGTGMALGPARALRGLRITTGILGRAGVQLAVSFCPGPGQPVFLLTLLSREEQPRSRGRDNTEPPVLPRAGAEKVLKGLDEIRAISDGSAPGDSYRIHRLATVDVKAIRRGLGLSQGEFGARFGFTLHDLRRWENGTVYPDASSRTLLRVIAMAPHVVDAARLEASQDESGSARD